MCTLCMEGGAEGGQKGGKGEGPGESRGRGICFEVGMGVGVDLTPIGCSCSYMAACMESMP